MYSRKNKHGKSMTYIGFEVEKNVRKKFEKLLKKRGKNISDILREFINGEIENIEKRLK